MLSARLAAGAIWRRQFFRFCLVGGVGFLVDAGALLALVRGANLDPYSGRVASFLLAVTVTWALNRSFTFAALRGGRSLLSEWLHYLVANGLGGGLNYGVYALCLLLWPVLRLQPVWAVAAGSGVALLFNFTVNKFVVFRRP